MIAFADETLNLMSFPIEDYTSLTWEEDWTAPGQWALTLHPSKFDLLKDAKYIYYSDAGWGIVDSIEYTNSSFKLSGRELSAILDDYVVSGIHRYNGRLEYCARLLLTTYSNIGTAPNKGYDTAVNARVERGSLMTRMYELLNPRGMSYKISIDTDNHVFQFEVLRGENRTSMQSTQKISDIRRQATAEYVLLGQTEATTVAQRTRLKKGSYTLRVKCNVGVRLGMRRKSTDTATWLTSGYATDSSVVITTSIDDSFAFYIYRASADGGVLVSDIDFYSLTPIGNMWAVLSESKGNIIDSKYTRNSRDLKNYVVVNVGDADNPEILEYDFRGEL